jgi:hypothetical protein
MTLHWINNANDLYLIRLFQDLLLYVKGSAGITAYLPD